MSKKRKKPKERQPKSKKTSRLSRGGGPFAIGVDLGGTNVRAGIVKYGKLVRVVAKPIRSRGSAEDVLEDLFSVIDGVLEESGGGRSTGIGVGAPSLVEPKTGTILDTTNIPSWKNVPLRHKLEKRYKVPARIDNDANCFALGERAFGFGRGVENFVGLIIGTGLGAGIISRGRLHSGVDCGAGEFGLIPYRDSIVEHYASGQFFSRFGIDGAELHKRAEAGDAEALKIFNQYGQHLAFAVKVVLYAIAPEMIVFGGSVSHAYPFFSGSLHESLKDFAYPSVLGKLKFKTSKLDNIAILGAAGLVTD